MATASYLNLNGAVSAYLEHIKSELDFRLNRFYDGFQKLKSEGFPVNAIEPEAALYLTVQFDLIGKITSNGKTLSTIQEVTSYLLTEAKLAIVPFYAFGTSKDSNWFRLSVGTSKKEDISTVFELLNQALTDLS